MIVTDQQIDPAAGIVERRVREARETADGLWYVVAGAVHAVRQAWRPGLISENPDLGEPPRMARADPT